MSTPATPRRRPGPKPGTAAAGHRPRLADTPPSAEQLNLFLRWHFFPASLRPATRAFAAYLGIAQDTLLRRFRHHGAGFTPAQCAAGMAHLEALHPRALSQLPPLVDFPDPPTA